MQSGGEVVGATGEGVDGGRNGGQLRNSSAMNKRVVKFQEVKTRLRDPAASGREGEFMQLGFTFFDKPCIGKASNIKPLRKFRKRDF